MSNTTTHTMKTRKSGRTFTTRVTVTRTPASLSESRMLRSRWFDYCHEFVTEVNQVEVHLASADYEDEGWTTTYLEIVTPNGRGCIVKFSHGEELMAFVMNSGKALAHGMWKKYGSRRGHCCAYLRAMNINPNSRTKVTERCPAALYATVRGEGSKWGVEAA